MIKSVYVTLVCFLSLIMTGTIANAADPIDQEGLDEYKEAVAYLNCFYSSDADNCGRKYSTAAQAREAVIKYKEMGAGGLNASEKAALDALFQELMMKITHDELFDYAVDLSQATLDEFFREFDAGLLINVTTSIPTSMSMDRALGDTMSSDISNASKGDFSNIQYVTDSYSLTPAELKAMNRGDDTAYDYTPARLQGVDLVKKAKLTNDYQLTDNYFTGIIKTEQLLQASPIGMETKLYANIQVKRRADDPWELYISGYSMDVRMELNEELYDTNEKEQVSVKVNYDMKKNKFDSQWANRYEPQKAADRDKRTFDNKQNLLEYSADAMLEKLEDSYEYYRFGQIVRKFGVEGGGDYEKYDAEMQRLYKEQARVMPASKAFRKSDDIYNEALGLLRAAEEYYVDDVAVLGDAKSKEIMSKFEISKQLVEQFPNLKNTRWKEERVAFRAVIGFEVYLGEY